MTSVLRHRIFIRDDKETELAVDYEISGGEGPSGEFGPPEHYDPGSSMEVCITDAWLYGSDADGNQAVMVNDLTEAEIERFDMEVNEDPETWEINDDR